MCSTATKAANDDAAGSVVYPVSSINQGVGDAGVLGDNVDVINVTMTTANTAKTHMQHLIQKINSSRVTESGWIDLYDGVNATKLIADISSAANLINANA